MIIDRIPPKTSDLIAPPPVATSHGPLLLGLLFGAIVSQNLVWPVVLRMNDAEWPAPAAIVAMGIAFAQLGLAAILLAWGSGRPLARVAVGTVLFLGAGFLGSRAVQHGNLSVWLGIMLLALVVVAAPLAIARLAGVVIVPIHEHEAPRGSRQFTILGLLSLTTFVAVLLGIGRLLKFPWGELGAIAVFVFANGAIPWTLAPIALGRASWRWPATLIVGSAVCTAAGAVMSLTGFPPNDPPRLAAMCTIQGIVIIAALAVVQIAGYRLVR